MRRLIDCSEALVVVGGKEIRVFVGTTRPPVERSKMLGDFGCT